MLPTQQADPCLQRLFFFSVRSYQDTAEQDKAGLMKAKQKEKREKAKTKAKVKDQNSDAQTCGSTCIPQLSLSL